MLMPKIAKFQCSKTTRNQKMKDIFVWACATALAKDEYPVLLQGGCQILNKLVVQDVSVVNSNGNYDLQKSKRIKSFSVTQF